MQPPPKRDNPTAFFYRMRVNIALNKLGFDPRIVDDHFRQLMQQVGQDSGNSPQEVALWIVSQLPLRLRIDVQYRTIKNWIRTRKINPEDSEMSRALREIGYIW